MIQQMLVICSLVSLPFEIQLEHLEVHSLHAVEPGLENFKHSLLACKMNGIVRSLNILWHILSLGLE